MAKGADRCIWECSLSCENAWRNHVNNRVIWKSLEYPFNFLLKNPYARSCGNIYRILTSFFKKTKPKQVYAQKETWTLPEYCFPWWNSSNPHSPVSGWSLVPPTSMELPGSPGLLDAWSGVQRGEELAEPSAFRAIHGTTFHGDSCQPRYPWGSIQLDSCLLECINWWFRCKIAWGHSRISQRKAATIPCS